MKSWRTMDSAPKDGSLIRVKCGANGVEATARWHVNGVWVAGWAPITFNNNHQPTYWREQTAIDDSKDRERDAKERAKALSSMKNSKAWMKGLDAAFGKAFSIR